MRKPKVTAAEFVARLGASVDTYHEDRDYAAFNVRQRGIWDEVEQSTRMKNAVLAQMRKAMYGGE